MPSSPLTFTALLAAQLRRDPGRPLVTFYDHATGERVELSTTTYANWVAKAAGLLVEEGNLERGMRLRIDLPPHWLGCVFLGAAWTVGLVLVSAEAGAEAQPEVDAVVCGPDELASWAPTSRTRPVFACSLAPLGVRFADPIPDGVHDVGIEVWSQPDAFSAWDPPTGDDPAWTGPGEDLTQGQILEAATAGSLLTDGGRLLSVADPASPPGIATFTEPLARGGSLVLVRNPDPSRLDDLAAAERVTHRVGA